ncbi:MAG TPA: hypothetical protein VD735_00600 [Candidatus Saccharimonadales bacterium]|nr:hypothetical protein [Candidatus Saccharimonadales bacterium]
MVREVAAPITGLRPIETFILPSSIGALFDDHRPEEVVALPWNMLPPLDEVADQAMIDASDIIDPAYFELQAGRDDRLHKHEREVGALLSVTLSDQAIPAILKTIMSAYGLVHDGGKTTPQMQKEYNDPGKWLPGKVDRLSRQHEALGEEQFAYFASQDGAHFAALSIARLIGGHHQRDLAAIQDPRVRWMVATFQEADSSQSILLDERKYMNDGTTREGISLNDVTTLERTIVKPFQAPHYFGIHPGRIFNAALGYRDQRIAQLRAGA